MALMNATDKQIACKPKSCPSCGAVECFERPRYFCGQLLTDQDLDAGQRYLIEKNKLHNRYLVGSGVVCGLAVRCNPCEGIVDVEPGFAIDCCGNDIVACETTPFDVNEYIRRCLGEKEPACDDKIRRLPSRCDEEPREYFLVISYNEEPAKPVTALNRDNGCAATRCEPSRTRETFRLHLVTEPPSPGTDDFWKKAKACLNSVFPISGDNGQRKLVFYDEILASKGDHAKLFALFCTIRQYIIKMYKDGPRVRCGVEDELRQIEQNFPSSPTAPSYGASLFGAISAMYGIILQLMKDCLCEALLVPCAPCDEGGVLLAAVTVSGGKVVKICNTVRKQVVTGPALRYWLQPVVQSIGDTFDKLCCSLDIASLFGSRLASKPAAEKKKIYLSVTAGEAAEKETAADGDVALTAFKRFGTTMTAAGLFAVESLNKAGSQVMQPMNAADRALAQVQVFRAEDFLDTTSIVEADISNQPVEAVQNRLKEAGVQVEVREETPEISAARTLEGMLRPIPAQGKVIIYKNKNGLVTTFSIG